ncbi:MAG: T9SS type A sorting domain-containing protein [Ignavibacteria bacterium]
MKLIFCCFNLINIICLFTNPIYSQWNEISKPYRIFSFNLNSTVIYGLSSNDSIFYSTDSGENWIPKSKPWGKITSFTGNDRYLFAGDTSGIIYRCPVESNSWAGVFFASEEIDHLYSDNNSVFAVFYYYSSIFGIPPEGYIYRATANGDNWTKIHTGGTIHNLLYSHGILFSFFTGGSPDHINFWQEYSTNNGTTWASIAGFSTFIKDIFYVNNKFYASANNEFYESTTGKSWNIKPIEDFKNIYLSDICFNDTFFFAASDKLFLSINFNDWKAVDDLLSGGKELTINKDYLFVHHVQTGTTRRYNLDQITAVESGKGKNIIKDFRLIQNYPNPFNPSTVITYEISSTELVSLKIYDLLGREIETLVNEEKDPGRYETEFNGSNLSSGIYFYRITAKGFSETKKMILMK